MKNNCPNGPPGASGIPAPLRVRLTRCQWAMNDIFRDRGLVIPADVERSCDLSYGPYGNWNLLDVYRPKSATGQLPVIVSIHGGGFFYGNKELYQYYCMNLAQRGFAVVNFNYRLAPEHRFPAPLEDINMVLSWICDHTEEYGLDVNNAFLVGDSAGAQLASQYAAIWSNPEYASLFHLEVPLISIRAVGLNCGIYDIIAEANTEEHGGIMEDYLGSDFNLRDKRVDVLGNINENYPPAHLISATNDFLCEKCAPMAEFLRSRGVEAEYKIYGTKRDITVKHVFHVNMRLPEGKQANTDQMAFFRRHIKE